MLLKNLIKLPKKTIGAIDERTCAIATAGANDMIEIIGNLEIELDVEKIKRVVMLHLGGHTSFRTWKIERDTIAQAIVDNFKEIIK